MTMEFAEALGIVTYGHVDEVVLETANKALGKYLEQQIGDNVYSEVLYGKICNDHGRCQLKRRWYTAEGMPEVSLPMVGEPFNSHAAYSFVKRRTLWLTANGALLKNAELSEFCEHSEGMPDDLPKYRAYEGEETRTSIVIPIQERFNGVWVLESSKLLPFSPAKLLCLREMGNGLCALFDVADDSRARTKRARRRAEEAFDAALKRSDQKPKIHEEPRVFLAFPESSRHAEIRDIVRKATEAAERACRRHIQLTSWRDAGTGRQVVIDNNILQSIRSSDLGIVYLSEYHSEEGRLCNGVPGVSLKFRDNLNVLFEAGMFHALLHEPQARPGSWIILREDPSIAVLPFDIEHIARYDVKRLGSSEISNADFLVTRIAEALISICS